MLRVIMHEDEFATGWTRFISESRLAPADGWQTLTLSASQFVTDKGVKLKDWHAIDMLELESQGGPGPEPVFRMFRWVDPTRETGHSRDLSRRIE